MAGIKIEVKNLNAVQRGINEYAAGIKTKCKQMQEYLAEIGLTNARFYFAEAQYDGENDVTVVQSPEWIDDNTLRVRAYGTTILFIEFGTGVHYAAESHPQADEFGYTRGSYGYHQGSKDSWKYIGEPGTNGEKIEGSNMIRTHGNPANRCMYNVARDMRQAIIDKARYVFG